MISKLEKPPLEVEAVHYSKLNSLNRFEEIAVMTAEYVEGQSGLLISLENVGILEDDHLLLGFETYWKVIPECKIYWIESRFVQVIYNQTRRAFYINKD